MAIAVLAFACTDAGELDFVECFGPQDTGAIHEHKLNAYDVRVWVRPGSELELLETGNPTVTLVGGRRRRNPTPRIDPTRIYVHATLKLQAKLGWRIYKCSVRIRRGPLKGAVIAICDGTIPPRITDAYQSLYALPAGMRMEAHELDCEVVEFWGK